MIFILVCSVLTKQFISFKNGRVERSFVQVKWGKSSQDFREESSRDHILPFWDRPNALNLRGGQAQPDAAPQRR